MYTGKSWLTVTKVLRDTITERVESHESPKDKMEFLAGLANFTHNKPPPLDRSTGNPATTESSKSPDKTTPQENNGNSGNVQNIELVASSQVDPKGNSGGKTTNGNVPVNKNKRFRREFIVQGQGPNWCTRS